MRHLYSIVTMLLLAPAAIAAAAPSNSETKRVADAATVIRELRCGAGQRYSLTASGIRLIVWP